MQTGRRVCREGREEKVGGAGSEKASRGGL
jgi:hypothetical protein